MRPYVVVAGFVVSAAVRVWAYQLTRRWRGPRLAWAVVAMGRWCRRAWRPLRLAVRVVGAPHPTPCLYLANHRSYLDIAVLSGVLEGSFLSRADVADWPVFGQVARGVGCVFVDRDDPRDRIRAARELLRRARTVPVVVFPEGTTRGDRLPGAFAPGLFRLVRRVQVPVIPVTLRYSDRRAYWVDAISMWEHLRTRVLGGPGLTCAVHIGQPLVVAPGTDEEALAAVAWRALGQPIDELGELCTGGSRHAGARRTDVHRAPG